MIIVTGGAGFIGSAFVWRLNQAGITDILIVDELGTGDKWKNLRKLRFDDYEDKTRFLDRVKSDSLPLDVTAIIHMGACSATTERDADFLVAEVFEITQEHGLAVVFAEAVHGFVQNRPELFPVHAGGGVGDLHGSGFLFARTAAFFTAHSVNGSMPGGGVQPADECIVMGQRACPAGEQGEDRLRHVLRERGVGGDAEGDGVNQVGLAAHDLGKRGLIAVGGELA